MNRGSNNSEFDRPAFWFVLVNFHGLSDTLECLESLKAASVALDQVIVVDNASSQSECDSISSAFPSVMVHRNSENQGWAGGNNRGIELALEHGADWVFLLNNDTVVHPEILNRMQAAVSNGSWDVLGPVINEYADRSIIQSEGISFNRKGSAAFFDHIPITQLARSPQEVVETDIVNGCAVAISRRVFESIGLIDERFFLICEESEFCLRAKRAGFRVGVLAEPLVWHKHSVSFARAGKPLQRYYGIRNLRLLLGMHATGAGRKGRAESWLCYLRHAYHLYSHERELDNRAGATSVARGLIDGVLGRYGPQRAPVQSLTLPADLMLSMVWRLTGGKTNSRSQASTDVA